MSSPTSISIDDDLSSCQTGISHGTSDDESARGIQVVDCLVVEVLGGDGHLDDLLEKFLSDHVVGDLLGVLGGDDDGVNSDGCEETSFLLVFNSDLGLGVGSEPWESAIVSDDGQTLAKSGGEDVSQWHEFFGLVGGVTEHVSLITSSDLFDGLSDVNSLSNVRTLLFNGNQDVASLVVETLGGIVEANALDCVTDHLLVINVGLGGNFSENHHHTSLGAGFASNLAVGVLSEASIQNGIGDLIAKLVRMSLRDTFGGEQE